MKMFHIRLFLILAVVVLLNIPSTCSGYRILGVFPLNGRSHMMMFEVLMKGLAKRGHQVDVVSTFPLKKSHPNYTDIVIPAAIPPFVNNMSFEFFHDIVNDATAFAGIKVGNDICEHGLKHPKIQKLIEHPPQDPPYDLVITEVLAAHCFMAFGRHLNVPVIGSSSSNLYPWANDYVANPENYAFAPHNLVDDIKEMNFWNRLHNLVHATFLKFRFNYLTSYQSELIKKHFGPDMPSIRELEQELALILTNSHKSFNGVKPVTPALIEVGGLHVQDDDVEIPEGHKKWLDESGDGFVYFTFGSMVTIESFSEHFIQILYKSLAKIAPTRVFLKVPHPELLPAGLPDNIRTFDWIPQLRVLKHKNIRAFITHSGLMGIQEAISCAVPMISIPLFADQFINSKLSEMKKIALYLDHRNLTEQTLDEALNEVLHNPIYKESAQQVADEFLDRPLSPLDEACFWVEYIIRHGSKALRSPALDFTWWQIALLDVYLALIIMSSLILYITVHLVRFSIKFVNGNLPKISIPKKKD